MVPAPFCVHLSPSEAIFCRPSRMLMRSSCTCSSILSRSIGAVAVLLSAPAKPVTTERQPAGAKFEL